MLLFHHLEGQNDIACLVPNPLLQLKFGSVMQHQQRGAGEPCDHQYEGREKLSAELQGASLSGLRMPNRRKNIGLKGSCYLTVYHSNWPHSLQWNLRTPWCLVDTGGISPGPASFKYWPADAETGNIRVDYHKSAAAQKKERSRSSSPVPCDPEKTQPIGVLFTVAPEPDEFARITPDWSVKNIRWPVTPVCTGVAVSV